MHSTDLTFREHQIPLRSNDSIYAREYARNGPTLFLLHGFPDNIHLYDYLVPQIAADFHLILFDFLGWNQSSKPADYAYTADDQHRELEAVIAYFKASQVWLAAHDASGPPAINLALDHPELVSKLILFNTYYSRMSATRKPEAIWMFSTPLVRIVTGWVARNFPFINRRTYFRQVGKFIKNPERSKLLVPKLYKPFSDPANFRAFLRLNKDLDAAIVRNTRRVSEMAKLSAKTHIIFGADDPYLNVNVAKAFNELIPGSTLDIIAEASHYVQVDQPERVADILLSLLKAS